MLTGVDDPSTPPDYLFLGKARGYEAEYLSSITHRTARAIDTLYHADIDDPASTTNDWEWDNYCTPDDVHGTRILWEDVVVAGHSLGGSMSGLIAHENLTAGVFTLEAFGEYCEVPLWNPGRVDGEISPYILSGINYSSSENPDCGTAPDPDCPSWFSAIHLDSDQLDLTPVHPTATDCDDEDPYATCVVPSAYEEFGLATSPQDYDAWDPISGPFTLTRNVAYTFQTGSNTGVGAGTFGPHASVADDQAMPPSFSGGNSLIPGAATASLYLFDAYLEGMCSL